ncbi:MAG TPA: lysophospholipid acyltransferase family protein, partial [Anaeromyxobacteraceae bacterium]|nr:lysophospholipid acyltransferase family protein [Anaeromyxobacteraceae bacterium]
RAAALAFSAVYWAFVAASMPVFFAGALLLFMVTRPFDRRLVALHLYSCFWASSYVYCNPLWRARVLGRGKLPWRGPAVIVSNHLSLVDIPVLYGLYRPFKWVSKEENFKLPFAGWNMSLNGYVSLARGDRRSIRDMMARSLALLRQGSPLLVFPEGTRSATGELQGFKMGAFTLAKEAGCPVIPVALTGTADGLPKQGLVFRGTMRAVVEVLDPLDPGDFQGADALRDAARAAIAAAIEGRRARAPAAA